MLSIFADEQFKGSALVDLAQSKGVRQPTSKEISINYVWLLPCVNYSPAKVPSAYFLTDVFVELDKRLDKKLFRPAKGECRVQLAGLEGCKLKRCLGALRALWRSSRTGGSEKMRHLKSFLRDSPAHHGRKRRPSLSSGDEAADEAADDPVSDEAADEPVSDEADPGPASEEPSSESDDEEKSAAKGTSEPCEDAARLEKASSDDSLTAPTLVLGQSNDSEESNDESSSEHRDSQVSSGWMGKAINYYGRQEREAMDWETKTHQKLLADIKSDLEEAMGGVLLQGEQWIRYEEWCSKALRTYGDSAYAKLSGLDYFKEWILKSKETDTDPAGTTGPTKQNEAQKRPFNKALGLMGMGEALDDTDSNAKTPAAKRPKQGDEVAKHVSERKGQDTLDALGGGQFGDIMTKFHEHDLDALGVPEEARPRVGQLHHGRHGYTARSKSGAASCPDI
ncbi:30S ribosomal protein S6 [Durusdinium trenchii]|uniref:30S ribosomal protein S6 n=1 Tax=Durusdinium trenchii TaxID=1381693 RepID=A0ABP0J9T3_9DINO